MTTIFLLHSVIDFSCFRPVTGYHSICKSKIHLKNGCSQANEPFHLLLLCGSNTTWCTIPAACSNGIFSKLCEKAKWQQRKGYTIKKISLIFSLGFHDVNSVEKSFYLRIYHRYEVRLGKTNSTFCRVGETRSFQ